MYSGIKTLGIFKSCLIYYNIFVEDWLFKLSKIKNDSMANQI